MSVPYAKMYLVKRKKHTMNNYKVTLITLVGTFVDHALAHNIFDAVAAVADYYDVNTEDILTIKAETV